MLIAASGAAMVAEDAPADVRSTPAAVMVGAHSLNAHASLEIPDEPCQVVLSAGGGLARVEGADPLEPGPRAQHDGWIAQVATTARSQVAVVTADGIAHRIDVVDLPALPRFETGLSFAAAAPATLLVNSSTPAVGVMDPNSDQIMAMGTTSGVVKRLRPDVLQKDTWPVITLEDGDQLVGFGPNDENSDLLFITSDAHLLRTAAAKVRPQGRQAGGMAGIKLAPGVSAIGFWAIPAPDDAVVVTVAAARGALPGTGQTTAKVTPLALYPMKGRGTQGVRAHRFLSSEDRLDIAWVGSRPVRAASADGSPVSMPNEDVRRDGSGTPVSFAVASFG